VSLDDEVALCRQHQDEMVPILEAPRHHKKCDVIKTGLDDVDCTCGLQGVLDEVASQLADEANLLDEEENDEQQEVPDGNH
jgi:hypothetical protein